MIRRARTPLRACLVILAQLPWGVAEKTAFRNTERLFKR